MSASRQKKLRQASEEPVVSSRAQEEMEKAARRKHNTIVYSIIGVVVVILVAILLIWNSGITQRNTKVAFIDGESVSAPQVAYYYYNNQVMYYANLYSSYGMPAAYDVSVSPKEQIVTAEAVLEYDYLGLTEEYVGQTYHDFFLDYALNALRNEYALLNAAEEAGYTLSDAGKAKVEEGLAEVDSQRDSYLANYGATLSRNAYLKMIYGKSMTAGKYRDILENSALAEEFYTEYFDVLTNYTAEELDAYYQANTLTLDTYHYYYRYFYSETEETVDADGNPVEPTEEESAAALAAALEAAEAAQAEVDADFNAVVDNEDYGESWSTPSTNSTGYEWLVDDAREHGDTYVMDTGYDAYLLLVFDKRYREDTNTVNVRHVLVEAAVEDGAEEPTEEAYAAAKKTAQDLLDEWKAGEATEESFAALAETHSADTGSKTNGGLYEKVAPHQMFPSFNDWIFDPARQSGDVSEPIQNTQSATKGWHLIYYVGQNDDPAWVVTARSGIWTERLKESVEIVRSDKLDSLFN